MLRTVGINKKQLFRQLLLPFRKASEETALTKPTTQLERDLMHSPQLAHCYQILIHFGFDEDTIQRTFKANRQSIVTTAVKLIKQWFDEQVTDFTNKRLSLDIFRIGHGSKKIMNNFVLDHERYADRTIPNQFCKHLPNLSASEHDMLWNLESKIISAMQAMAGSAKVVTEDLKGELTELASKFVNAQKRQNLTKANIKPTTVLPITQHTQRSWTSGIERSLPVGDRL